MAIGAAVVSVLYYWQVAHQAIPGPVVHQDKGEIFCGSVAGIPCPTSGYTCIPEDNFPDAGTNCRKSETTNDTLNWKTFESKELGVKFEYPSDWGEISLEIKNGETYGYTSYPDQVKGKTFAAYYKPPGQNSRYALFGGISSDFQTNRGGQFFDSTGYVKNLTAYYFKYIQNTKYLLDSKLISEVTGVNTTGIFIDPITYVGMEWYYPWRYGAIFNLKSSKDFSGIAFELYIPNPDKDPDLAHKKLEFQKLLSTLEIQ